MIIDPSIIDAAMAAQQKHVFANTHTCVCGYQPTDGEDWGRHQVQVALTAVLEKASSRIRLAAEGRREYAVNAPDDQVNILRLEASVLDSAARIAEGDMDALRAWLPSWRWTKEMNEALRESGRDEPPEPKE